jgi:anthranilate phosphoribosyltransferase
MSSPILGKLLRREELGPREVGRLVDLLSDPMGPEAMRAALLVALTAKGETEEELICLARELRRRAVPFAPNGSRDALDLCGSGGAVRPSFNVSTVSAFVVAAAGQSVVKHGNRSARGHTGSSDLLEALGLPVVISRAYSAESFRRYRLGFLHAPLFHPSTRSVASTRKVLGIPTVFNRLGPLSNPAHVRYQLVGVADRAAALRTSRVLRRLGVRRGLSVTAEEGSDEFSPRSRSTVVRWDLKGTRTSSVRASDHLPADDRRGPWGPLPPHDAARETQRILAGAPGARRGAVLLTSGAALWTAGISTDLRDGVERARDALDSGGAETLLEEMQALARSRTWGPED